MKPESHLPPLALLAEDLDVGTVRDRGRIAFVPRRRETRPPRDTGNSPSRA